MENKEEKLSYEELEERLNNTVKQYIDLSKNFRAINNTLSRLEMLFKVIENFEHFSKEFAEGCAKEIEAILTIKNKE